MTLVAGGDLHCCGCGHELIITPAWLRGISQKHFPDNPPGVVYLADLRRFACSSCGEKLAIFSAPRGNYGLPPLSGSAQDRLVQAVINRVTYAKYNSVDRALLRKMHLCGWPLAVEWVKKNVMYDDLEGHESRIMPVLSGTSESYLALFVPYVHDPSYATRPPCPADARAVHVYSGRAYDPYSGVYEGPVGLAPVFTE